MKYYTITYLKGISLQSCINLWSWEEDNLSTRDKWPVPEVSSLQGFYCSFSTIQALGLCQLTQFLTHSHTILKSLSYYHFCPFSFSNLCLHFNSSNCHFHIIIHIYILDTQFHCWHTQQAKKYASSPHFEKSSLPHTMEMTSLSTIPMIGEI